ncbi:hypothetical protein TSOC_006907 [Tetrabaena socialis]|uniref:AMMECR1 domain-containing protein n=1 Tax=Tetrabaena socialis TaxID=47790 RepID=A0A2J8A2E6_9CHLO|nr:hypothetical protein TSOC_006907 [Tetrabaena socialis]|eukprot:PNH06690.1 hypothetical protein TSOC_006907 [Tetrabaena socialis]
MAVLSHRAIARNGLWTPTFAVSSSATTSSSASSPPTSSRSSGISSTASSLGPTTSSAAPESTVYSRCCVSSRAQVSAAALKAAGRGSEAYAATLIIIRFADPEQRGVRRTATFLPDVAPEQGWDRAQAVDALVRKAGYAGPITAALREAICLERYQSTVAAITYEEYAAGLAAEEEAAGAGASGGEAVGAGASARAISLQVAA